MADRALKTEDAHEIAAVAGVPEAAVEPERLLPENSLENPRWNATAGELGRRAGRAMAVIGVLPRLDEIQEQIRERLRIIRQQAPGEGTNRIEELRNAAASRVDDLRNRAQERLQLLRNRAERMQRERPIELIAGAFGAAFLLGMALRIWRSNGDE